MAPSINRSTKPMSIWPYPVAGGSFAEMQRRFTEMMGG
jgi:hypothetical protein